MPRTGFPTDAERIEAARAHVGCRVGICECRNPPHLFGALKAVEEHPNYTFGADYPDVLLDFGPLGQWRMPAAMLELPDPLDDNPHLALCCLTPDKALVELHKLSFRLIY